MKSRFSKLKLLVLALMSAFGIWASTTVLIIFYTLHDTLPICPNATYFGLHLDCGAVLGSKYSVVFGVPLELFALFYFIVNIALVFTIAFGSDWLYRNAMKVLFGWRFIGIIIVPYLVFIEVGILHAICVYCTMMHVAIVIDFIIISYLLFFKREDSPDVVEGEIPAVPAPAGPA